MHATSRPGPRGLARGLILLSAASAASGCAVLYPQWHECRPITSAPVQVSVSFVSAPERVRGYLVRTTASVTAYQGGGIALYAYSPGQVFGRNELHRCRRLSTQRHDFWIEQADVLASLLEPRRGEQREIVTVAGEGGRHEGLGAVDELVPEALAAARAIACSVRNVFGDSGIDAIREAAPLLSARLAFPTSCPSSEVPQQPP